MTARAGVEPTTLRLRVIYSTRAPSRPVYYLQTVTLALFPQGHLIGVVLEVLLSTLREVVHPGVLDEGGEDEGEAHKEEDVQGSRVRHLGDACAAGQADR